MTTLETKRLFLRPFVYSDADAMNRVFGDAEVMYFGYGVQSREWVRDWIRFRILEYQENVKTNVWAVVVKTSTAVIGYCGLFYFPEIDSQPEVELGYRLARLYWNKGYGTEAARAVKNHAVRILGIKRLIAMIDPGNLASIRVAEKLGMQYEKDVKLDGYTHPDRVYVFELAKNNK
jgi:RimJ/RimL family protein N-acetyltransferase